MTYISYLKESVSLYKSIYKVLSTASSISNKKLDYITLNNEINYYTNKFYNVQEKYVDLTNSKFESYDVIDPDIFGNDILISNSSFSYFKCKINFYVDSPNLNEYKIIVDESGVQQHHSFKQENTNCIDQVLKISDNIFITFSDNIINKIRVGEFPSFFKVKFEYDANNFPLLRLPFHKKRIFLKNYFWVMSVLNKMDYEVSILQKRIKNKKYNLYINNNKNINLDEKTKTLYN